MNAAANRIRSLPQRWGRTTLTLLALIVVLGLGLRAYSAVSPVANPADDSHAYYALAKALYEDGSFGGSGFHNSSDWSPGAPLLYAASFYATGGAREGTARVVEALLGAAAIVVVFLLGARIACRPAGLIAAFGVAVYPPFIHTTGELMSEPPAIFFLPAAVLAFLRASDLGQTIWRAGPVTGREPSSSQAAGEDPRPRTTRASRWLVPGLLFGVTAMIRPEYLVVGIAFAALAVLRAWRGQSRRSGAAAGVLFLAAFLLPIVPWTIRNAIVLDRLVPISTGGGKALYVGTYLPADGDYQRVKALLVERYYHRNLEPGSAALDRVNPTPLFTRVADRYPDLPRDSALGKIGKQNFSKYFGDDPVGYLGMTVRKVWRMWSGGVGAAMSSTVGRVVQVMIVLLALAGFGVLAWRRWWWTLTAMAAPIVIVTTVGAISLATSRRNEILMTLIFPLAGAALARAGGWTRERGRARHPAQSGAQA